MNQMNLTRSGSKFNQDMSTYADLIRFEESVPPNTIRLVKSGDFYRACDHSAWLFQSCIAELVILSLTVRVFLNLSVLASCLSAARALTNMLYAVHIVSQAGEGTLRPQETLRHASSVPYSA